MLVMDIAEWIANMLILGIAVVVWAVGIFLLAMIVSMANKLIKTHIIKDS
jgi:hypothetical protein|tara:strand:- start:34881 stop:35030 length:150 start_codon:yes stop_codon:yes gene_type:complete